MVRIHIIEMAIFTIGPAGATGTTAATAIPAIDAISEIIIVTDAPKAPTIKDALGAPAEGPPHFGSSVLGRIVFLTTFFYLP